MGMSAGAIRAGEAYVAIGADDGPLRKKLQGAEAMVRKWGQGISAIGAQLAKIGGVVGAGIGVAAGMFADFEQNMARVKAVIEPTTAEFAALNKEALRLGAETVFSSSDAARAMSIFAQAGLKAGDILRATGPTIALASVNMLDMATATGAVLPVMKGMQLDAAELTRTVDVLGGVSKEVYTNISLLSSAFSYVASDARNAGMSLEETAAAIGVLQDKGQAGERAGTVLRGVLADLKAPSEKAVKALKELGVRMDDPRTGNWRAAGDIFRDLGDAMKNMGTYARSAKLSEIFDTRSGPGATVLMDNLKQYLDLVETARRSTGVSSKMSATMLDTLSGSWKMLTSSVEGLVLSVGGSVAPLLRQWGDGIVNVVNSVTAWADKNGELFRTITKITAGLVAAGAAMLAFGAAVRVAAFALGGFAVATTAAKALIILYNVNPIIVAVKWIANLGFILGGLSGTLGIAAVAMTGFAIATALAKTVMLVYSGVLMVATAAQVAYAAACALAASPLLALAAAAGLAGVAILATTATAIGGFQSLGAGLAGIGDGIIATFGKIKSAAGSAIAGMKEAFEAGDLEEAMTIAGLGIQAAWEILWANLKAGTLNQFSLIGAGTVKAFVDAWGTIETAWVSTTAFLGDAWDVLVAGLKIGWNEFVGWMRKLWVENSILASDREKAERKKQIDQETSAANEKAMTDAGKSIGERGEATGKRKAEIDARTKGLKDVIDQDVANEIRERNATAALAGQDSLEQIDLLRARRRYKDMGPPKPGEESLEEWVARQKDMGPPKPGVDTTPRRGGADDRGPSLGTFSATAAGQIGVGTSLAERIANATRQTAENTKKLAEKKGGLVVG